MKARAASGPPPPRLAQLAGGGIERGDVRPVEPLRTPPRQVRVGLGHWGSGPWPARREGEPPGRSAVSRRRCVTAGSKGSPPSSFSDRNLVPRAAGRSPRRRSLGPAGRRSGRSRQRHPVRASDRPAWTPGSPRISAPPCPSACWRSRGTRY